VEQRCAQCVPSHQSHLAQSCRDLRAARIFAHSKAQKFAVLAVPEPTTQSVLRAGDRYVAVVIWLGIFLFAVIAEESVIRQVGAQQVARQAVDDMAYVQAIPDPRDPRLIVRPRNKGQFGELKKASEVLLPEASGTRGVVTDPNFPHKAPGWSFIKDTRKDSK
jgi:hypothetical protein